MKKGLIIWGTLLFTPCKNGIFKGAIWGIWTNCFRKLLFYLKAATSKMVSSDNTVKISTTFFFRNSTLGKLRISIYNGPNKFNSIKNSFQNHPKNHLQNLKFRNKCDILDIRKLIIFKLLSNCNSDRNSFTNYLAVAVIEQSILLVITHEKDRYNTFY